MIEFMRCTMYRRFAIGVVLAGIFGCGTLPAAALVTNPVLPDQSATLLPNGRILLAGGRYGQDEPSADLYSVDSRSTSSPLPAKLHIARWGHTATLLPDGTVAIIGGFGKNQAMVSVVEIYDPTTQTVHDLPATHLLPRAMHTATVLDDGTVLLVGGVTTPYDYTDDAQVWNPNTGAVKSYASAIHTAREKHEAVLLSDGKVLISGGTNVYGAPVQDQELIQDPQSPALVLRTGEQPQTEDKSSTLHTTLTIPEEGASNFPLNEPLRVLFSQSVDVRTVSKTTCRLLDKNGAVVAVMAIPVEAGRIAFITPKAALQPAAEYTLVMEGVRSASGTVMPTLDLHFSTSGVPESDPSDEWIPSVGNMHGNWTTGAGPSQWESLPDLTAGRGITALSGKVLRLSGLPLANVTISYGGVTTRSDQTGRFLLEKIPSGRHVLTMDGRTANHGAITYGFYEAGVTTKAGITNPLSYTIWMAQLDTTNAVTIPSPTAKETIITTPRIPGLELHLPAGTTIVDNEGRPVKSLSITAIPVDRPPFPLPLGVKIPTYFTIQPGGSSIHVASGSALKGAWLVYPNAYAEPAGSTFDFWNYDADARGWYVYGQGKVNAAGKQVDPNAGVLLYELTGAMVGSPTVAPGQGPTAGEPWKDGEPVDLSSGLFVYNHTDLTVNDSIPLVLTRTYRPNDSASRSFGVGQTDGFNIFMVGQVNPYTYQELILPDGSRIRFNRTSNGTSYGNAVYLHTASRTRWYGATLTFDQSSFAGAAWVMRTRDGMEYVFPDSSNQVNAGKQAVIYIRDPNGNTVNITRTSYGDLSKITSPGGRSLTFVVDASHRITSVTDNIGRVTTYAYDAQGNLSTYTNASGGVTKYTYDDQHNMLTIVDPNGNTYLTNVYDASGRVTKQTMSDGGVYQFTWVPSANAAQTWIFDSSSTAPAQVNRYSTTDQEGYTGLISSVMVTDPRGYIRKVVFNGLGFKTSDTFALNQPEQQTYAYNYYADNLVKSVTDPLGRVTSFDYDINGNVSRITRNYGLADANTSTATFTSNYSQMATVTNPLGNSIAFGYDASGNLLSTTDALGEKSTYSYDADGHVIQASDPLNNSVKLSYLGNEPTTVTDQAGNSSSQYYDAAGRLLSVTDALNHTSQFSYDLLDHISTTTDARNAKISYTYDGDGNVTKIIDPLNHATSFTYDSLDRAVSTTDALSRASKVAYDEKGNPVSVTDAKGQITALMYDALNRVKTVGYNAKTSGSTTTYDSTVNYTYDAVGRMTKAVDSTGGTITRTYDDLDRLTSETSPQGTITYVYDAAGRMTSAQVTGQTAMVYAYDNANHLLSITQGSKITSFTYDADGRRTTIKLPNGISGAYTYDSRSNVLSITYTKGATTVGNLTYTYDSLGQRTSMGGSLVQTSVPTTVASATYDAANQLTNWNGTAVTYDKNGSMLSDGTNTYTWNARNQLTGVAGQVAASFTYDALNRRESKTVQAIQTSFLYEGDEIAQEKQGSALTNLIPGNVDEFFDRADSTTDVSPLIDAQGTVVALADASGNLVTKYAYDAYGNTTLMGTVSTNTREFTGREHDFANLYYYRARYYNPALGRFLSEDPLGLSGGINEHVYTDDNPSNLVDPLGLFGLTISLGAGWGGTFSIGYNSGQWSFGAYGGLGEGFSVGIDPLNHKCEEQGFSFGGKISGSLKLGKLGGLDMDDEFNTDGSLSVSASISESDELKKPFKAISYRNLPQMFKTPSIRHLLLTKKLPYGDSVGLKLSRDAKGNAEASEVSNFGVGESAFIGVGGQYHSKCPCKPKE
jgi:RHS repeat-associated protein